MSIELRDITDWYLPESDPSLSVISPGEVAVMDGALCDDARALAALCATHGDRPDFTVIYKGISYRGHQEQTVAGAVFILRRLRASPPKLDQVPSGIAHLLTDAHVNNGGLIVVCGGPGQGKSTTAAATVVERLEKHGGICWAIEDPPEMPLHGRHGRGVCYQIDTQGDFSLALKGVARSFPAVSPALLFLGEVRDEDSAIQLFQAATKGVLVITTVHAPGLMGGLHRLITLAGGEADARYDLLAANLRLMVHQRIEHGVARFEALVSRNSQSPVASLVRRGRIDALATELESQQQKLRLGQLRF